MDQEKSSNFYQLLELVFLKNLNKNTLILFESDFKPKKLLSFRKKTDLICAANAICHIPNLHNLIKGISILLSKKGLFIPYGTTFFLIPLVFFTIKLGFKKLYNFYLIFFLICFQGFIGWYMVSSGLVDRIDVSHYRLSIHLLMAFIILSLIYWNYLKLKSLNVGREVNNYLTLFFVFLIFLQIVIGAFVSGMDAGRIYNSWPLMGNNYFPDDNEISNLFNIDAFNDPSLVQFIHRNLAYLILFVYLIIFFQVYYNKLNNSKASVNVIGFLLILQIILGILTILNGAQIYIASMHQISSIFLVSACIYFYFINTKSNLQPSD